MGIRELRQNLSVYLRRVSRGENLEVTERGRVVALLVPAAGSGSALEQLVAAGRATAPSGDLLDLGPPPAVRLRRAVSRILDEDRSDRL